jgi:hypothetical protein
MQYRVFKSKFESVEAFEERSIIKFIFLTEIYCDIWDVSITIEECHSC